MKTRTLSCFLILILTSLVSAQKWPITISPSQKSGQHSVKITEKGYLYETTNYRIEIPEKIDNTLVKNFVMSTESVAVALQEIPLPLFYPSGKKKPVIQICLNEKSYYSAGGRIGTAGFYDGGSQKIIIQWDQLKHVPTQSKLLRRPAFDLLVHELTHLCMDGTLWKMEPWLTEGVAEYLAAAHLAEGNFNFRQIDKQIRDHIRKQTAPEGQQVPTTNIKLLLELTSRDWLTRTAKLSPKESLEAYTSALLLTHFAFHGGSERREDVRTYLEELKKVTLRREPKPILFSPNEASTIEKKLKVYWNSRGLHLNFK